MVDAWPGLTGLGRLAGTGGRHGVVDRLGKSVVYPYTGPPWGK
jgi:hypothetical protein